MEQTYNFKEHVISAENMLNQGRDKAFIETAFNEQGLDSITVSRILEQAKKTRNAKRTQTGITLTLIGIALLGLGFIITMILHHNGHSVYFPLYGLTAIGAFVLIVGLVMLFH